MRLSAFLLVACLVALPLGAAAPTLLLPAQPAPDAPAASDPVATVVAFDRSHWSFTEGTRTATIAVPAVEWNRVVVRLTVEPGTDPWDRLFGVGIDGTEVLHGTTPRAPMTIEKDVTAYASLLPPGGSVPVQLHFGTWVGEQWLSVALLFYDDASAALVRAPHDAVVSPFFFAGLGGPGSRVAASATFPATPAARGAVELTFSGHGANGEFWWLNGNRQPPTLVVLVDGVQVGRATAMPYVYALLGFSGNPSTTNVIHTAMWWTAQRALDAAGIHHGAGEIPAYRAELPPEALALLTGARNVEVVVQGGSGGYWPASLSFLLDEA